MAQALKTIRQIKTINHLPLKNKIMKTFKFNTNTIKSVFVMAFVALTTMSFAHTADTTSVKSAKETKKATKRALTKEEIVVFKKLDTYRKDVIEKSIEQEVLPSPTYKKVIVLDSTGKVIQEQDASKAPIDLTKLPTGSSFFMAEGDVKYYMTF